MDPPSSSAVFTLLLAVVSLLWLPFYLVSHMLLHPVCCSSLRSAAPPSSLWSAPPLVWSSPPSSLWSGHLLHHLSGLLHPWSGHLLHHLSGLLHPWSGHLLHHLSGLLHPWSGHLLHHLSGLLHPWSGHLLHHLLHHLSGLLHPWSGHLLHHLSGLVQLLHCKLFIVEIWLDLNQGPLALFASAQTAEPQISNYVCAGTYTSLLPCGF